MLCWTAGAECQVNILVLPALLCNTVRAAIGTLWGGKAGNRSQQQYSESGSYMRGLGTYGPLLFLQQHCEGSCAHCRFAT